MLRIACLFLVIVGSGAGEDALPGKAVSFGRTFGTDPLPAFDKGYLLYLKRPADLSVHAPNGVRLFDTTVRDPHGREVHVQSAAIDTDGTIAVASAFSGNQSDWIDTGGIAFLDLSGKQTRFVPTGGYMPAGLGFDQEHFLWVVGQGDKDDLLVRKVSKDGKEVGAYLAQSLFGGLGFSAGLGLWRVRAANDRVGLLAYAGTDHELEWVELNLEGKLLGRWTLGARKDGGYAYTADGRLYGKSWDEKGKPRLTVFDRAKRSWIPVQDRSGGAGQDLSMHLLLGADQNDLVFTRDGAQLIWVKSGL